MKLPIEAENVVHNYSSNLALPEGSEVNILMGQTFDDGQPIDLIKYGLYMGLLADAAIAEGKDPSINIVLADSFIYELNQSVPKHVVEAAIDSRRDYMARMGEVYGVDFNFVLSSELNQTSEYEACLAKVIAGCEEFPDFSTALLQSVPEQYRDAPKAVEYPAAELATVTSLGTDVKVGPVYEFHYDNAAAEFFSQIGLKDYVGVQLTKGFPFGKPKMSRGNGESIEEFGILPYKIRSKSLQNYRIDPTKTPMDKVEALLRKTRDQRALDDLANILQLAAIKLGQDGQIIPERNFLLDAYEDLIHKRFQEE